MCEVVKVLERELENSGLIYVYQEGGEEFNFNSPKQLGVILFEKLEMAYGK